MPQQSGFFQEPLREVLFKAPLTQDQTDKIWKDFYNPSIPLDAFEQSLQEYNLKPADKTRVRNWRLGLFGGPDVIGVADLEGRSLDEAQPTVRSVGSIVDETVVPFVTGAVKGLAAPVVAAASMARAGLGGALGLESSEAGIVPAENQSWKRWALGRVADAAQMGVPAWQRAAGEMLNVGVIEPAKEMARRAEAAPTMSEKAGYYTAAALPMFGPMAAQLAERGVESYETGSAAPVSEALGELAAGVLAPKGVQLASRTIRPAVKAAREQYGASGAVGAMRAFIETTRSRGTSAANELLSSIGVPKRWSPADATRKANDAISDMARAANDLPEIAPDGTKRVNPNKIGSDRINPETGQPVRASASQTFLDAIEAATAAKKQIWSRIQDFKGARNAVTFDANELANALESKIPQRRVKTPEYEALRQEYKELADAIRSAEDGVLSLDDIDNELNVMNAVNDSFYNRSAEGRSISLRKAAGSEEVNRSYLQVLNEALDSSFDKAQQPEVRNLMRRYGTLSDTIRNLNSKHRQATTINEYDVGNVVADMSLVRNIIQSGRSFLLRGEKAQAVTNLMEGFAVRDFIKASKEMESSPRKLQRAQEKAQASSLPDAPAPAPAPPPITSAERLLPESSLDTARRNVETLRGEIQRLQELVDADKSLLGNLQSPLSRMRERDLARAQQEFQQALEMQQMAEASARQAEMPASIGEVIPVIPRGRQIEFTRTAAPAAEIIDVMPQAVEDVVVDPDAWKSEFLIRKRELEGQAAREAERNAAMDEAMFRGMAQQGIGAARGEMKGAQRVFEREQKMLAQQQAAEAKAADAAARTQRMLEKQQRIDEAVRRLEEAKRAEQQTRAETAKTPPKKEAKAEKPLTEAQKQARDAQQRRERAAEEVRKARADVAQARKAPAQPPAAPRGKVLMWLGQPIELVGEPVGRYQQFRFVGGPNRGKIGWQQIQ